MKLLYKREYLEDGVVTLVKDKFTQHYIGYVAYNGVDILIDCFEDMIIVELRKYYKEPNRVRFINHRLDKDDFYEYGVHACKDVYDRMLEYDRESIGGLSSETKRSRWLI